MPYSIPPARPQLRDPLIAQRNPFELYLLIIALVLGVLSLFGIRVSAALSAQSPPVILLWGASISVGSFVGLVGLVLPLRSLGVGLLLERFGMILMAGGVLTYAWIVGHSTGTAGFWSLGTNLGFGLACITRVVQISRRYSWYARLHREHLHLQEVVVKGDDDS